MVLATLFGCDLRQSGRIGGETTLAPNEDLQLAPDDALLATDDAMLAAEGLQPALDDAQSLVADSSGTYVLPSPDTSGSVSVEEALQNRRSRRNFQAKALSKEQLSQILWSAYGITEPGRGLRTTPSAGATYPLEIYVIIGNVTDIEAGVYKYNPLNHEITRIKNGDIRSELSAAALRQTMVADAPITVVYAAVFSRIEERYGERGRERYVFMEIGHSAQNVYLQAEALGLGTCAIGAFSDDTVKQLLNLPADEVPLYLLPVGHIAP